MESDVAQTNTSSLLPSLNHNPIRPFVTTTEHETAVNITPGLHTTYLIIIIIIIIQMTSLSLATSQVHTPASTPPRNLNQRKAHSTRVAAVVATTM